MEHVGSDRERPLSAVLREICDEPGEMVTLGEVTAHFGPRAFGALLFVLAIPNLLPLPPGSTTILGAPIMILAPQLAIGVRRPWLPKFLDRRPIRREWLRQAYAKVERSLLRIEMVSGPRLTWMFGPWGERLVGLACSALAFVLILPIPLGNVLPSITIGLFGFSLIQRDGVVALAASLLTAASVAALTAGVAAAWLALRHILGVLGWI
ncbi:MAG TPA: exopolysaccharide biosynthesis protein [Caulobacteraceae bacterium]